METQKRHVCIYVRRGPQKIIQRAPETGANSRTRGPRTGATVGAPRGRQEAKRPPQTAPRGRTASPHPFRCQRKPLRRSPWWALPQDPDIGVLAQARQKTAMPASASTSMFASHPPWVRGAAEPAYERYIIPESSGIVRAMKGGWTEYNARGKALRSWELADPTRLWVNSEAPPGRPRTCDVCRRNRKASIFRPVGLGRSAACARLA